MKIATLNLCHHAHRWEERLPLIVKAIIDLEIDLISLQEVWTHLGPANQAQIVADAINMQLGCEEYQASFTNSTRENSQMGIAMLARIPVEDFASIPLPGPWRVAQMLNLTIDGHKIGFVNTHFHNQPVDDESIRLPQAERLMEWVHEQDFPCIISGDFNAPPNSSTILRIKESHPSAYETIHGKEPEFTYPTPLIDPAPTEMVDYLFYDPQAFTVKTCDLFGTQSAPNDERLYASDHYGLVAEIDWLKTDTTTEKS